MLMKTGLTGRTPACSAGTPCKDYLVCKKFRVGRRLRHIHRLFARWQPSSSDQGAGTLATILSGPPLPPLILIGSATTVAPVTGT
jgi:hypothetical protein